MNDNSKVNKKSGSSFFLWWKINPDQIKYQIDNYNSLKINKSARGISFLLLLLSASLTFLIFVLLKSNTWALLDVSVFVFLGFFIYRGHKWAMIGSMILWTYERGYAMIADPTGIKIAIGLIFWALYMHFFYLSYLVERQKEDMNREIQEVSTENDVFDELLRLSELKDKGIITDEEFMLKKKQILNI